MSDVQSELPRYRSHKLVWALKIASIELRGPGGATITPSEPGYGPFEVDAAYVARHQPKAGGYFVVYDGGYKSWSPADAFEAGYTRTP